MNTRTMLALSAVAVLGLSACGGGTALLTQEQTRDALLTEEDFPLEGFTAGTVEEGVSEDGGAGDVLEDFPGGDQLSDECVEAMGSLEAMDADFTAQSTVEFTGADTGGSLFGPPTVQVTVAALEEGDNPLDLMHSLNDACDEVTFEEDGLTMTMNFNEIEGAQGTKISLEVMGQGVDVAVVGREDGGNFSVVMAMGASDEEIIQVLDAQQDKISNL